LHYRYFFIYKEDNIKDSYHEWQLETSCANPRRYLHTYAEGEVEQLTNGQVIAVKYCENERFRWKGKVRLKKFREEINLTNSWVRHTFHHTC